MAKKMKDIEKTEFLEEARERFATAVSAEEDNRREALSIQQFLHLDRHWDEKVVRERTQLGLPVITMPVLPQFTSQVVGEMLQNKIQPHIIPSDKDASITTAKVLEGHLRDIIDNSNTQAAFDCACTSAIETGYGLVSIDTKYSDINIFEQEVVVKTETNPFSVIFDADAKESDYSDARYCFEVFKMEKEEFEDKYPGFDTPDRNYADSLGNNAKSWVDDNDLVTLCKYFVRDSKPVKYVQLSDGSTCKEEDATMRLRQANKEHKHVKDLQKALSVLGDLHSQHTGEPSSMPATSIDAPMAPTPVAMQPQDGGNPTSMPMMASASQAPAPQGEDAPETDEPSLQGMTAMDEEFAPKLTIVATRTVEVPVIYRYLITGNDIVEGPVEWVSTKFFPYFPVFGRVSYVEGKKVIRGLVNRGVSGQKLLNAWLTDTAERIMSHPRASHMATPKQLEGPGVAESWAGVNTDSTPILIYNPDDRVPGGAPVPVQPMAAPSAQFAEVEKTQALIKSAIGMYSGDIGAPQPQQGNLSGVALGKQQAAGDTGTYQFHNQRLVMLNNVAAGILDIVLTTYDTEREVNCKHEDGSESVALVNTTAVKALKTHKKNPKRYNSTDVKEVENHIKEYGVSAPYNELTEGQYQVRITAGPAFATQRDAAADKMLQFVQVTPNLGLAEKYFLAKDIEGLEEYTEILRKQCVMQGIIKAKQGEEQDLAAEQQQQQQQAQNDPQVLLEQARLEVEKAKIEVQHAMAQRDMQVAQATVQGSQIKVQGAVAKNSAEAQTAAIKLEAEQHKHHGAILNHMQPQAPAFTKEDMRNEIVDILTELFKNK